MSGDRSRSPRERGGSNWSYRGGGGSGGVDRNRNNYGGGSHAGGYDNNRPSRSANRGFDESYGRVDRRSDQRYAPGDAGNYGRQDFHDYRRERRDDRNYREPPPLPPVYRGGGGGEQAGYYGRNNEYGNDSRNTDYHNRGGNRRPVVNPVAAEQHRLNVSQRFPNRQFLEDVDLPPEFAFRLDNTGDSQLLTKEATKHSEKSTFVPAYYRDNMLGCSEDYKKKYRLFNFRCQPPPGIDAEGNAVEPGDEQVQIEPLAPGTSVPATVKPKRVFPATATKPLEYMNLLEKTSGGQNSRKSIRLDKSGEPQDQGPTKKSNELSIRDKTEYYNSALRKDFKNINLWKEFVQFQDRAFEEDGLYHEDGKKKVKKVYNKHLIQKKIAILDKAVAQNPRCPELHLIRLDYVIQIFKPIHVMSNLKELVANSQQVESLWLECLRHISTQLQLFTSSGFAKDCTLYFEKLRTMLNPSYPDFQRPQKMHILLSDLRFSICLILRNAGLTERALAIHQAQLEHNFYLPVDSLKSKKGKYEWAAITKLFELFWNLGTLRFGEPESVGWANTLQQQSESFGEKVSPVGVSDSEVSALEDLFFGTQNESAEEVSAEASNPKFSKSENWLYIESARSKLHWTPWRAAASDLDECDDNQRVVLATEVIPFLTNIPTELYKNEFEKQASSFRSVVQYLQTLQEDFLPRTHTLESIQSPFTSISLSEPKTLFSEIHYWKQFLDLYHTSSAASTTHLVPEAFKLSEFTLPYTTKMASTSTKFKVLPESSEDVESKKNELLQENLVKYNSMIRCVVEQSIEFLSPDFASLLVQMLFRFYQKNSNENGSNQEYKALMKFGKNIMKHEKLRSSTAAYGELGLLEYFSGKKGKACDLLVKTINSTSKLLKSKCDEPGDEVELSSNWETIAEVTKVYRIVAELHLREQPTVALNVLVSLGNNFDTVGLPSPDTKELVPATTNSVLKAKRLFESIMESLVPSSTGSNDSKDNEESANKGEVNSEEMAWLHQWNGEHTTEFFTQKVNLLVEWTVAFALFRFLSDDFEGACDVYRRVLDKIGVPEPLSRTSQYKSLLVNTHFIREQLYINWTKLSALAVAKDPVQNSVFRTTLGKALDEFPCSPPLLLLFSDIESQCSVAGKLWRGMVSVIKQEGSPSIATLHWAPLFMCLALARRTEETERDSEVAIDSFGLGGPAIAPDAIFYKLDALLSAAENNILTRHCPLIWRVHLKSLSIRATEGKDSRRAHGLFYDAIRHCPSSKSLCMDVISYFPEMMTEVLALMAEKQLLVRLPVEELALLLEIENELENENGNVGKDSVEELSEGELDD